MITAIDVETQGLDCTKYITGCLIKENNKKAEIFRDKKKLWEYVIELGKKERAKGKMLNVYAHNATFDFYAYANLTDPKIKWFCHKPFIVAYTDKDKEIIKFLDTWSIFRMPLKELGRIIGKPKLETPSILIEGKRPDFHELKEIEHYMVKDAEICLDAIKMLKKKLREEGINIKRLYTINQIAINHLVNTWRNLPDNDFLMWNNQTGETRRTLRPEEIHSAYRAGRVEAFRTGLHSGCTLIDVNSLWPWAATKMEFPDLRSERKIWKPEKDEWKNILGRIGLSKVLMKNKSSGLGLLHVRLPRPLGSYIPKRGQYLIGTHTHTEINQAIKEGYELINIEWSVIYDYAPYNPLKDHMNNLFHKRKKANDEFDNYFYKALMNNSLGRLGMRRNNQALVIDDVEKAEEYLKNNYEIKKGIGTNYMYQEKEVKGPPKKYYTPIVPCLVNAHARVHMYKQYKAVGLRKILYTDTDSIMFQGSIPKSIKLGEKMGQFRVLNEDRKALIYGRKTYMIGEDIKVSGIHKSRLNTNDFEKGYIEDKKMITMSTAHKIEDVGKFVEDKRDLHKQCANHNMIYSRLKEESLLIDCDITDINYFLNDLSSIT